jgi:hypothetical protein
VKQRQRGEQRALAVLLGHEDEHLGCTVEVLREHLALERFE